jgi:uncharacterized membrane protein YgaE (UPF0421/DUF939 family)
VSLNHLFQLLLGLAIGTAFGMVVHYKLGNFKLAFILMISSAVLALLALGLPREDKDDE